MGYKKWAVRFSEGKNLGMGWVVNQKSEHSLDFKTMCAKIGLSLWDKNLDRKILELHGQIP